jgi:hypothetical protein
VVGGKDIAFCSLCQNSQAAIHTLEDIPGILIAQSLENFRFAL